MKKIKCLLVDDEKPAIQLLQSYASKIEQLEVVDVCHDPLKAFDLINKTQIDLIFLDIQMPIMTGIKFIKTLNNPPAVIFTTAYRKYAIESYELDVIDYLLKPFGFDRFLKAVDKYRTRDSRSEQTVDDYIFYNVNRTKHKVFLKDIYYLESLKDYTRIHSKKGQLVVRGNLSTQLKQLPTELFIRTHRSFAIGINHVESYNQSSITIKESFLPLGLSYREAFLAKIAK